MRNAFIFFLFFTSLSSFCQENQKLSDNNLLNSVIGIWEMDYNMKVEDCGCGDEKPDYQKWKKESGLTYIIFRSDLKYISVVWGDKSVGTYRIVNNEILFDLEGPTQEGVFWWKIEKITKDKLIIFFRVCDTNVNWTYLRVQ